ncbi:hypothetical protein IFM89_013772 [Coptis chinensis]|uniref:N-acetyltransferase domain-containing protein n=1 Tax=Coptis chinensis TaxID=261450 RepID=A0A835HVE6_9MAGN|nr:hypothetical protein IFM89_013772 [Coptis chinensis]
MEGSQQHSSRRQQQHKAAGQPSRNPGCLLGGGVGIVHLEGIPDVLPFFSEGGVVGFDGPTASWKQGSASFRNSSPLKRESKNHALEPVFVEALTHLKEVAITHPWFRSVCLDDRSMTYLKEVAITHPWRRSICLDDRSIGFVSIFPGSGEYVCRDIGYALAAQYWGRG